VGKVMPQNTGAVSTSIAEILSFIGHQSSHDIAYNFKLDLLFFMLVFIDRC
jgi:hypothetical protein